MKTQSQLANAVSAADVRGHSMESHLKVRCEAGKLCSNASLKTTPALARDRRNGGRRWKMGRRYRQARGLQRRLDNSVTLAWLYGDEVTEVVRRDRRTWCGGAGVLET
jgi:hypothetical protein